MGLFLRGDLFRRPDHDTRYNRVRVLYTLGFNYAVFNLNHWGSLMPFKIINITASSVETFKACEEGVAALNKLIQILNGNDFNVNVGVTVGTIELTPVFGELKELRVMGGPEINWIDYRHKDGFLMLNTKSQIFKINFKAEK